MRFVSDAGIGGAPHPLEGELNRHASPVQLFGQTCNRFGETLPARLSLWVEHRPSKAAGHRVFGDDGDAPLALRLGAASFLVLMSCPSAFAQPASITLTRERAPAGNCERLWCTVRVSMDRFRAARNSVESDPVRS